ncbi:ABC transporter G family member 40 [Striga hermonthica]|uniref:ABC transporter G family member 40 n=1 Tax=Striga hermonthica TaxID=68872 RepID=A0A9N7NGZ0_STRHE|nr:ABC transporter G family member 40 [Striga hermonthica]
MILCGLRTSNLLVHYLSHTHNHHFRVPQEQKDYVIKQVVCFGRRLQREMKAVHFMKSRARNVHEWFGQGQSFCLLQTRTELITVFLTVLITIAAALASSPEVGSSMNKIEGLATRRATLMNKLESNGACGATPVRVLLVGLPGVYGLSTEQRKRLTIAVDNFEENDTRSIEAARTSILSNAWHHAAITRPNLDFDVHDFRIGRDEDEPNSSSRDKFSKFVKNTILRYEQLKLKIGSLRFREYTEWAYPKEIVISSRSLERLNFVCFEQYSEKKIRFDVPNLNKFTYEGPPQM